MEEGEEMHPGDELLATEARPTVEPAGDRPAAPAGERPTALAGERPTAPQAAVEPERQIEAACRKVMGIRRSPLLILFYPPRDGSMEEADVTECYDALRNGGLTHERPIDNCDILLHTTGGSPAAGYRLAQCIRDFARNVTFLVPEHAFSAGTVLSFSG